MTRPLLLSASALLASLAACGDQPEPVREPADDAAPEERIVLEEPIEAEAPPAAAVTDTLGAFEGAVSGLAVWEHPAVPYEGAVLAANGEAGLAVVSIDQEVPTRVVEGEFDGGVAVGYPAEGASLVAAGSGEEVVLFRMGADRVPVEAGRLDAPGGSRALCMTGERLVRLGPDGAATAYDLTSSGDALMASPSDERAEDAVACAATRDVVYLASGDGSITATGPDARRYSLDGKGVGLAALATGPASAGDVLLVGDARGAVTAVFAAEAAEDRPSAALLLDDEVVAATRLAAGSGNLGGIYRDGVVAVLDEGNALHLVPWAGLARALGAEPESVSLRPGEEATARGPDLSLPALEARPPALD